MALAGLDQPRLCVYLREQLGAAAVYLDNTYKLGGGAIQENWALQVMVVGGRYAGQHHWVLRTDAPTAVAASHGRAEEFQLLKLAYRAGLKVPKPICCEPSGEWLGAPFFIAERLPGFALGSRLVKAAARDGFGNGLVQQLGVQLAHLHQFQPPLAELTFLCCPDVPIAQLRVATYRDYLERLAEPQVTLEYGLAWLQQNAPTEQPVVLCHGDFRTGNLLVDEAGQLQAILDWEFADWGTPLEDLAWFCARCWRFGAEPQQAGGLGSREVFYQAYLAEAELGEIDERAMAYWEIMAALRWAVIALLQFERFRGGGEQSLELALTGAIVPDLEYDILQGIEAYQQSFRCV